MSKKKKRLRGREHYALVELEPAPTTDVEKFVPFPMERFLAEKALWAANYFVLWPLGLALTASAQVVDGFVVKVNDIHVREWTVPEGKRAETINQSGRENKEDYETFLAFVRERLLRMSAEERVIAMTKLANHGIASPDQILGVKP